MKIEENFKEFENYFVVESKPLEATRIFRSSRSNTCKVTAYAFSFKGFCTSRNLCFHGDKLHTLSLIIGQNYDLSPGYIHYTYYLQDIKSQPSDSIVLQDREYISKTMQLDLFNEVNIQSIGNTKKPNKNSKGFVFINLTNPIKRLKPCV